MSARIRAGEYRRQVDILEPTYTTNAFGERISSYAVFDTVWSKISPVSGRELEYAMTFAATVSHRINMYYMQGITEQMQIRYTDVDNHKRIFLINAILNVDENDKELLIYATEEPI